MDEMTQKSCYEYAKSLFELCGHTLDCYHDISLENTIGDLKDYQSQQRVNSTGFEFPYPVEEIAAALIKIGTENYVPTPPAPYIVVYDTDSFCDSSDADSLEAAKAQALEIYASWEIEEAERFDVDRSGNPIPTSEQIEKWDYMIQSCSCHVKEYDPEAKEYFDCWFPPDDELKRIGWVEWKYLSVLV